MAKDESQIKSSCPQCGEILLFPERHRGMKGRCPDCSLVFTIGEYLYRDTFDGELTIVEDDESPGTSPGGDVPNAGFSAAETDRLRSQRFKKTSASPQQADASSSSPFVGVPMMAGPAGHSPAWAHLQTGWFGIPGQNLPGLIPIAWPTAQATPPAQAAPSDSRELAGPRAPLDPKALDAALEASFRGSVPARPFLLSQRIALIGQTIWSLLLFATYLLATFALLALFVWHAVANSFLLPDLKIGFTLLWLITLPAYIGGLVVFGGFAWLFAKHLFAPRRPSQQPTLLTRETASRVHRWVENIAESIGSPRPHSIAIDASIDPHFDFVAKTAEAPRGYQLVMGAPLVAATTLPQLTAVVAQTMGMRARNESPGMRRIIRGIWRWFETRAREPDLWDERARKMATEREGATSAYYWALVAGAWIVRGCLWPWERIAALLVSPAERQWISDADHYAIRLAGSHAFEQTLRKLRVIRSAWRATLEQARQDRADGKTIPNLPKVLADNLKRMPVQVEAQLAATADRHETERFAKLPSDRDRIAAARQMKAAPLFECNLPSSQLFDDFETLARKVTRHSAVDIYGQELAGAEDESAGEAERTHSPKMSAPTKFAPSTMGRDQFFFDAPMETRVWQPIAGTIGAARPLAEIVNSLVTTRAIVAGQKAAHKQVYAQWNQGRIQAWEGGAAVLLMEKGFPLIGTPLAGKIVDYQVACRHLDNGRLQEINADQQLRQFERNAATRLFAAYTALRDPQVAAKLGEGPTRLARAEFLLDLLLRISQHLPALQAAQQQLALLNMLHTSAARCGRPLAASQTLDRRQPIADEALRCRQAFDHVDFPFESTVDGLSMAEYLLPQAILPRITMESIPAISRMADRMQWLHDRIVNELCGTALDIERVLGIK